MNKFLLLSAAFTATALFAISAKTDTVVSSTAITIEDYQTEVNTKKLSISLPSVQSLPSAAVAPSRIRTNTQLQIIVNTALPIQTSSAAATNKPNQIVTASPRVTPQATLAPSVTGSPKPTITPTAKPISNSPSQSNTATDEVIRLVNVERTKVGLPNLTKNTNLTNSAQSYANTMANQNFFSHTGLDGSTFLTRNKAAGYSGYKWMGENIAAGQSSPQEVMSGWMTSSGHKANILNSKAKEIGVGYASNASSKYKKYWVQEFGAR